MFYEKNVKYARFNRKQYLPIDFLNDIKSV